MPRKLRRSKRRISDEAERRAWGMMFKSGFDYLDELDPFGFRTENEKRAAAPDAWRRFGADFMTEWTPDTNRQLPWAHEQFGEPPCR